MPKPKMAVLHATTIDQAKTASEMARACLLRNLQSHFKGFLSEAKLHELYFLDSVLMDFGSSNLGPTSKAAESPLAEVFMALLDSDDTYIKVPRDHIEAVEHFLAKIAEVPEGKALESGPVGRPKLLVFPAPQPRAEAPHAS